MNSLRHADDVLSIVKSNSAAALSPVAASWRRSAVSHKLDPEGEASPQERLSDLELRALEERNDLLVRTARPRIEALHTAVRHAGCCVVLTDPQGIILTRRTAPSDEEHFDRGGLGEGYDWSEAREGTNGIGTCLVEKRPVIIHRNEHFMTRHTGISCIDAPVFGASGELLGALDVSTNRDDQTQDMNKLLGLSVQQVATQIETDIFAEKFSKNRIIVAPGAQGFANNALIAVDEYDIVIGATRAARLLFELGDEPRIEPVTGNDLLSLQRCKSTGLERGEKQAIKRALVRNRGNATEAAKELGIGRATLYRRMNKHGLSRH